MIAALRKHFRAEEAVLAASAFFGLVHREVCVLLQDIGIGTMLGEDADPQARADTRGLLPKLHRQLYRLDDAFGDAAGIRVRRNVREQDRELVAAHPRERVGRQVQSSRRLERECQRNVELMWLTGRLAPDFKTIADFRRDNGSRLKLFSEAAVAVDGSKFKAVNSRDRNFMPAKVAARKKQPNGAVLDLTKHSRPHFEDTFRNLKHAPQAGHGPADIPVSSRRREAHARRQSIEAGNSAAAANLDRGG